MLSHRKLGESCYTSVGSRHNSRFCKGSGSFFRDMGISSVGGVIRDDCLLEKRKRYLNGPIK